MRIGELNKRIELEYPTRVSDGMGSFDESWVSACTIFAAIWPVSASEHVQNQGIAMTVSHRIRIRYRGVLRSSWRIKYGEKYYNIVSIVNPNMANKILDIMCKEVS